MIMLLMVQKSRNKRQKQLDKIVEESLRGAAIWDEVKID